MVASKASGKKLTDSQTVLTALRDARMILAAHIEPGPRDCEATVDALLKVLDDRKLVEAIDRLDRRFSIRIVTIS